MNSLTNFRRAATWFKAAGTPSLLRHFSATVDGPVHVLSERIMTRGFEPAVDRMMEEVESRVKSQPGLLWVETLRDTSDHHKYIVLSKWESKKHYDDWLTSENHSRCTAKIDELLDLPGKKTRIFSEDHDDIFLL